MYGKVIGAMIGGVAGLFLAAPVPVILLLAIVGLVLGHVVVDHEPAGPRATRPPTADELLDGPAARPQPRPPRAPVPVHDTDPDLRPVKLATADEEALARVLSPLFIEVARADAVVSQPEIRVAREFFEQTLGFGDAAKEAVRVCLKAALAQPPQDVQALTITARGVVKPGLRLEVVRALYDCALVDGALARSEHDVLKRVVQHLNLSDEQLQQITTQYFGAAKQHLEVLGLPLEATDDEVRSAFRRLAAENHPDRAASLGPKEAELAGARFRLIKDAYEELRKIRGF